jgi:hypothetical protein
VSLELLDDVAIHRADGGYLLEQSKSALSSNPAADRAEVLWKTFTNWADLCAAGTVSAANTDFRLYVMPAKVGDRVQLMHAATTKQPVADALARIKKLHNPKTPNAGCNPYLLRFLNAGDQICSADYSTVQTCAEDEPGEAVREYVRPGVPAEAIYDLSSAAIGMARDRADKLTPARVIE